jgi:flagellar biosynthetic protein FliR
MLETFIELHFFAFLLIFTRIGVAMMVMPGIGESFTPTNVRLLIALGLSLVMTPSLSGHLPALPSSPGLLFMLIGSEAITGLFIGTVMRLLISALDTAGMIISLNTGLANAQVFNPTSGGQGSIIGAFFGVLGVTMILVSNMHHFLLLTIFESYQMFPADGYISSTGQMAEVVAQVVNTAFNTGAKLAMPFIIVTLVLYTGFGLLGRLMPQIQIFFLALPVQILLAIITLMLTFSTVLLYWMTVYEETVTRYLIF